MAHDFKKFPELTNGQLDIYYWDSPHKQITESFVGTVVKVTDGDSIRLKTSFRDFDFPLRLQEIDAAELDTPEGRKAQQWLEREILGEEVYVEVNFKNRVGKFGRLIGDVVHMGQRISQLARDLGYAADFGEEEDFV